MKKDNRKQKFIEFVASGENPYQACIKAGYSPKYAKTNSHILREKYEKQIEDFKPIAKEVIEKEFKYSVKESFAKLNEIQSLAMLQDEKGNFQNLAAAIKAEELKGKMYGVYEADNEQKRVGNLNIVVTTENE